MRNSGKQRRNFGRKKKLYKFVPTITLRVINTYKYEYICKYDYICVKDFLLRRLLRDCKRCKDHCYDVLRRYGWLDYNAGVHLCRTKFMSTSSGWVGVNTLKGVIAQRTAIKTAKQ